MASRFMAATSSKLEQRYFVTPEHQIHFTILAWFVPDRSWVKPEVKHKFSYVLSDLILEHEQHHFDIAEIFAREIRQSLSNIIFYDSTYKRDIPKLFKKYYDQYRENQVRYDNETGHGGFKRQQDWVNSIDEQLRSLKKYSDTAVIVNIY